ncbi:LacI family DNA-binding transcriptional regulator [Kineococcus indalonis]|uniref:LacI family DNA-binding transcriptional regulator n=1 Tax=Kineococcus indalonis TaxID=2696566 RepID=UPI00141236A1|nr:LacI family DNA-binding transcriptional regulator [Kineococcus indalonis]NAZ84527.1 substrate-binding domain-containing protein [Kineococcus indalonis]
MEQTRRAARRPTISDVATAAGVSRAAVSKVLRDAYGVSEEMRSRVHRAIEELDYRPSTAARALRGTTSTIGVMLPLFRTSFFDDVLAGAVEELETSSYQLILAPVDSAHASGRRALEALSDRQVDGIVALSPLVEPTWLESFATRTALVELGRHDPSARYDTVVGDDVRGAELVMEHLLALGHRRVLHVTHHDPDLAHLSRTPPALRRATYEKAMTNAGLAEHIEVLETSFDDRRAAEALRVALEAGSRPSAVFAGNDDAALGVLRTLAEAGGRHGLSPRTVSVCGYDDTKMASHPLIGLTSVDQDGAAMGRLATRMLLERIAGREQPRHEVIQPRLVVRSSSREVDPGA